MNASHPSLAPVASLRPPVADYFGFTAEQLFRVTCTEFAFPGDFVAVLVGERVRFGRMHSDGLETEKRMLAPDEYEILATATPMEDYQWPNETTKPCSDRFPASILDLVGKGTFSE